MKYFGLFASMSGQHMSVCMISNKLELLFAPFLDLLVCLPLMQSTQVSKSAKSKVLSTPSFTNHLILSIEICPNLRCHNIEDSSFTIYRFNPTETCIEVASFCNSIE